MKWPPETGPNIRMIAYRPAAVAAAFSSNSRPVLPGDRLAAAMPEPTTVAVRNALPANSAVSRRHSTISPNALPFLYRHLSIQTSLPGCIDPRQHRGMSIQDATRVLPIITAAGQDACSQPALIGDPIDDAAAAGLAPVFKALGDPVRLRLVSLIGARQGGEVCVCDLTSAFDLTQPTISHHLKVLREAGLIDSERRGTWVYYRVVPAALERLAALLTVRPGSPSGVA